MLLFRYMSFNVVKKKCVKILHTKSICLIHTPNWPNGTNNINSKKEYNVTHLFSFPIGRLVSNLICWSRYVGLFFADHRCVYMRHPANSILAHALLIALPYLLCNDNFILIFIHTYITKIVTIICLLGRLTIYLFTYIMIQITFSSHMRKHIYRKYNSPIHALLLQKSTKRCYI